MSPTILVVDDDPIICQLITRVLTPQGYTVTTARDSDAALTALAAGPDLVLSDVYLPDLDGLTMMAHIRQTAPELPIIAMSAACDAQALLAADDRLQRWPIPFLPKPFALAALLAIVQQHLLGPSFLA